MDGKEPAQAADDGAEGLEYPIEFELRVIYTLAEGSGVAAGLGRILTERRAALGPTRELPSPSAKYGRLACSVRFADKEGLYAAYAEIGALPGVKAVL
ncbi:MAG: DUF493 family protein [Spirochaetes bacterium]|nr:DUF493 family protein [Spirochaetota bacterium]MBU1080132.1 DUF493 family protein [Spirochaetota bacterium]